MPKKFIWVLCAAFLVTSAPALADDHRRGHGQGSHLWSGKHDGKHRNAGHWDRGKQKHYKQAHRHPGWHHKHARPVVVWHGHRHWAPPPKRHVHHHHHHYRRGAHDSWAVYAILALQLVDTLNESQRDHYAWAQQRAVAVPLGETIDWQDSGVYGAVTPVRDGIDGGGRYCREFQHQVTVGGRLQSAYGVACRQPDGAWEIVS